MSDEARSCGQVRVRRYSRGCCKTHQQDRRSKNEELHGLWLSVSVDTCHEGLKKAWRLEKRWSLCPDSRRGFDRNFLNHIPETGPPIPAYYEACGIGWIFADVGCVWFHGRHNSLSWFHAKFCRLCAGFHYPSPLFVFKCFTRGQPKAFTGYTIVYPSTLLNQYKTQDFLF